MDNYQRAAIDSMHDQVEARDAALTQARELLAEAAVIEYQRNRSPRGVSPDGSLREAMDFAKQIAEQIQDIMRDAITDLYLDDRKNGRL